VIGESGVKALQTYTGRFFLFVLTNLCSAPDASDTERPFSFLSPLNHSSLLVRLIDFDTKVNSKSYVHVALKLIGGYDSNAHLRERNARPSSGDGQLISFSDSK